MVPFGTMNVLPMRALPPLVLSADAPAGGPEPLPLDQRQGSALWPVPGDFALGGQVAERQLQAWEADQQEEEEEEEARQAEQLTDALLRQEAKMMAEQGYRPKVGSRSGRRCCRAAQPGPALPGWLTAQGAGLLPSSSDSSLLLFLCVSSFLDW